MTINETDVESGEVEKAVEILDETKEEVVDALLETSGELIKITDSRDREYGFVIGLKVGEDFIASEIVRSSIVKGEEENINLTRAMEEINPHGDVFPIVMVHSHPEDSAYGYSEEDVASWEKRSTLSFPGDDADTFYGISSRPLDVILFPGTERKEDATVMVIAQTGKDVDFSKLATGDSRIDSLTILGHELLVGGGETSEQEMSEMPAGVVELGAKLKEKFHKAGFEIGVFRLDEEDKIRDFVLEHIPSELDLELVELDDVEPPPPNLDFLPSD